MSIWTHLKENQYFGVQNQNWIGEIWKYLQNDGLRKNNQLLMEIRVKNKVDFWVHLYKGS